jgi:Flp pilus assembly protein TadG
MSKATIRRLVRDHKGATIVFVALAMVMLLGFAALAVDMGYLYVVRNELQNAADSGALAGAQVLYNDMGTSVNAGANAVAQTYVLQHQSEQAVATVQSIERGHWSFATRTFTPNDSLVAVPLWDVTTEELDADTNFINAVRVVTRRKRDAGGQLPEHFFARVFGAQRAEVRATAVGYIGFAGKLEPFSVDQPIAICQQAIRDEAEAYTCGVGRMLNSGQNEGHQTAGWTNFSQPCETANTDSVRPFVCAAGNTMVLELGQTLGTTNGTVQTVYDGITDCWYADSSYDRDGNGIPDLPWPMVLPVIDCPGGAVSNCSDLVGAVEVNVVWITRNDKNQMVEVPRRMGDWPPPDSPLHDPATLSCNGSGVECWNSFVQYFHLKDILNNTDAFYEDKTLYFLPDCTPHEPTGVTGGQNFGILARVPVLVK